MQSGVRRAQQAGTIGPGIGHTPKYCHIDPMCVARVKEFFVAKLGANFLGRFLYCSIPEVTAVDGLYGAPPASQRAHLPCCMRCRFGALYEALDPREIAEEGAYEKSRRLRIYAQTC